MAKEIKPVITADEMALLEPKIRVVWNYIGHEVVNEIDSNAEAIEVCIDADRLLTNARSKEANDLVTQLCKVHGYSKVLKALAAKIRLV